MIRKQFELTGKCNLRCEFCYNKEYLGRWGDLDSNFVLHESGKGNNIFLGGGEPTLYRGIEELVKQLIVKRNIVVLSTNALEYKDFPDDINFLMQVNLPSINNSLYKEITKVRSDKILGRVIKNIDRYVERHGERVYINFVAYDRNLSEIEDIANFCKDRGIALIVSKAMPIEDIRLADEKELEEKCLELVVNGHILYSPDKNWRGVDYFTPQIQTTC